MDLLAILPFYLSFGVDLRTLRAFGLLRLFKILRLPKYARAIKRIRLALIKEEMILLFVAVGGFALSIFYGYLLLRARRAARGFYLGAAQFVVVFDHTNHGRIWRHVPDHRWRLTVYLCRFARGAWNYLDTRWIDRTCLK